MFIELLMLVMPIHTAKRLLRWLYEFPKYSTTISLAICEAVPTI